MSPGAARPPRAFDRLVGTLFFAVFRLLGLYALPWLVLHPKSRPHVLGLLAPEPGWTWLHGASAGEHVAARALLPATGPTTWRTKSSLRTPVPGAFPAPLDLPFVFAAWLDRARPSRLVLVEAELWPGWLWHCRRRGVPVVVVNARDSRGTSRWRMLGPLWRWLTEGVRFVDQAETGDLKLLAPPATPAFSPRRPALLAASTRAGDEARLLAAWKVLPAPRPLLILAPRHGERFAEVAGLVEESGLSWERRSEGAEGRSEVLLLDVMGEVAGLMHAVDAAFVGGSFDPALGGHSPAEAFAAGLPVLAGPHRHANPQAWASGRVLDADDLASGIPQALALPRSPPPTAQLPALPAPVPQPPREARPFLWPVVPVVHTVAHQRSAWSGAPQQAGVPVVSVGAIASGGAGKTPAVGWLADALGARLGEGAVWVVARGYGRSGGGDVRTGLPGAGWTAADLGDELELLRRRGLPVVSAPDRVAGARAAAEQGARLVLLDDGFQHRRLHRDLDVVCLDAAWPAARGPIPVGTAREPLSALGRAQWVWESHGVVPDGQPLVPIPLPRGLPGLRRVQARLRPLGWRHRGRVLPLDALSGEVPVAVGIARPERFLCTLLRLGLTPRLVRVAPDHGALGALPDGCVLTEKDAARLPQDADVYALLVAVEAQGGTQLVEEIAALVEG